MAHDHHHPGGMELLDALAAHSPLRFVHPGLKLAFALAVIFAAIGAAHWAVGLAITASMVCAMGALGGIPLRRIGLLLRVPLLFLAVGCLVVLLEWSRHPAGLWSAALAGRYLRITAASCRRAGNLFCQALGAVSAMYFLSTTTPMPQLIEILRRWKLPELVIELMYLIYRYLFVLLSCQRRMTIAATVRLGYHGLGRSVTTAGKIGGNLLAASFRRSRACYDAMEARCYDGRLAFLNTVPPVRGKHLLAMAAYLLALGAWIFLAKGVLPG